MKQKLNLFNSASKISLIMSTLGLYSGLSDGIYTKFDAGVALQQSIEIDNITLFGAKPEIDFNPGLRLDLAIGTKITENFSLELDTAFIYNSTDTISFGGVTAPLDLNMYQIPILLNGRYEFEAGSFRPYIGAGLGGAAIIVTEDSFVSSNETFVFAYQAEAGVNYMFSDSFYAGIGYKFLGTTDLEFDLETSPSYNHAILASIGFEF